MNKNNLETIQAIIQILNNSQIPKSNLSTVLEVLAEKLSVTRSFLLIHQIETDRLSPIAANGLDVSDFRRLDKKAEKSLFRTVFESGKSFVLERLSVEPTLNFLQKTETETSLIILPIILEEKILGVLAAEFLYREKFDFEQHKLFLSVVASLVAQAFRLKFRFPTSGKN